MTVSGTPAFMPPETWSGRATEKSDQYSLAGSYVELRLNRHLFPSTDMAGAMLDHLQKMPDVAALPDPEQQVLLRALAKVPEHRFDTCMEFWEALREAVGPGPAGHGPASRERFAAVTSRPTGVGESGLRPASARPAGQRGTINFGRTVADRPTPVAETAAGVNATAHAEPSKSRPRRRPLYQAVRGALILVLLGEAVGITVMIRNGNHGRVVPPAIYLPDGFQREVDAKTVEAGGQSVYDRIAHVFPDQTALVFILIPKKGADDPAPFYILRDKVTNHAFEQFARDDPSGIRDASWRLGAAGENNIPLGTDDFPFHPVVRVCVDDANRFAHWLGGLLPTARQWDKAAGRFDGAVGPFVGDGKALRNEDVGIGLGKLLAGNRACADRDHVRRSRHGRQRLRMDANDSRWRRPQTSSVRQSLGERSHLRTGSDLFCRYALPLFRPAELPIPL